MWVLNSIAPEVRWTGPLQAGLFVLLLCLGGEPRAEHPADRWLLVDTASAELRVMDGDRVERVYPDIAIGRYGTTRNKRRGDNQTPLGRFRIVRVHRDSPFLLFLGLSYPAREDADRAYQAGVISKGTRNAIRRAEQQLQEPPQNTPLGGNIGIHGIGAGDPLIHQQYNWTNGCVAISNDQITELATMVELGTEVVIR